MERVGQAVSLWQSGRNHRVSVAASDRGGSEVHCGSQRQRPQVWSAEKTKEVRKPLAFAWPKNWNQALGLSQFFTNCEAMAGLLKRGQVVERSLLVGGIALDGIDDDHGVQEV